MRLHDGYFRRGAYCDTVLRHVNYIRLATLLVIPLLLFIAYKVWADTRISYDVPAESEETATTTPPAFVDTTDPNELLPDLVPLPAQDMVLQTAEDGRALLLFSTTYYNQGRGPVELRADDETTNIRADIEREVMQRVYFADGGHRDKLVGTFLWHQEHLHYHFSDFIEYDLESLDNTEQEDLSGTLVKSTFCLRDISRVYIENPHIKEEAEYEVCYKRLQGVSVGWGDTYYYNYPDQNLDVSSLKTGTYSLTFRANPENRLDEINYENNTSRVVFRMDMENKEIEVLEEFPEEHPEVEHVHLDDPFGI